MRLLLRTFVILVITSIYLASAVGSPNIERPRFTKYVKINADDRTNDLVEYAYNISGGEKDFIHTIECENGQWQPLRQSNVYKEGDRETSYGLCQRNTRRHSHIVNHPDFHDPYWQVDKCREMYSAWYDNGKLPYRLYGYNNRNYCATKFTYEVYFLGDV